MLSWSVPAGPGLSHGGKERTLCVLSPRGLIELTPWHAPVRGSPHAADRPSSSLAAVTPKARYREDHPFNLDEYMVVLDKPLGLILAPDPATGKILVQGVEEGSPADLTGMVQVGDIVKMCSAVFGEDMWQALDMRRVRWAINNRTSKIKLVLERTPKTSVPPTWFSRGQSGRCSMDRDGLQLPVSFTSDQADEWPQDLTAPGRPLMCSFHNTTLTHPQSPQRGSAAAAARNVRLQCLRDELAEARKEPEMELGAPLNPRPRTAPNSTSNNNSTSTNNSYSNSTSSTSTVSASSAQSASPSPSPASPQPSSPSPDPATPANNTPSPSTSSPSNNTRAPSESPTTNSTPTTSNTNSSEASTSRPSAAPSPVPGPLGRLIETIASGITAATQNNNSNNSSSGASGSGGGKGGGATNGSVAGTPVVTGQVNGVRRGPPLSREKKPAGGVLAVRGFDPTVPGSLGGESLAGVNVSALIESAVATGAANAAPPTGAVAMGPASPLPPQSLRPRPGASGPVSPTELRYRCLIHAAASLQRLAVRRRHGNMHHTDADACNILLHCSETSLEPDVACLFAAWLHWYAGMPLQEALLSAEIALGCAIEQGVVEGATEALVTAAEERVSRVVLTWRYGGLTAAVAGDLVGSWSARMPLMRCKNPSGCKGTVQRGNFYLELNGLKPGIYYYKYVVDGTWAVDPAAPKVLDASGNWNNVLEVQHRPPVTSSRERLALARCHARHLALENKMGLRGGAGHH